MHEFARNSPECSSPVRYLQNTLDVNALTRSPLKPTAAFLLYYDAGTRGKSLLVLITQDFLRLVRIKAGAAHFEDARVMLLEAGGKIGRQHQTRANPVFFSDLISKGNTSEPLVFFFSVTFFSL